MRTFVAVDIGGTHIRAAAYESNNLTPLTYKRTRSNASKPGIFERLVEVIESIWPDDRSVTAIGISSPGPLDPSSGVVLTTPNIPEWQDFPLTEQTSKHFKVPVCLDNDASLAALGEWKFGAGRDHKNVLYLTISTGIGGGVIVNNCLLRGQHGLSAELGHVAIMADDGPICSCGQKGHLEALAAGPAIVRFVKKQMEAGKKSELSSIKNLNAQEVAEAAKRGDKLAIAAYNRAGEYLGIGVASFLHIFNPSIVIFGGGVSRSGDLLFNPFKKSLHSHVFYSRYLENLTITTAELGDDSGLLGAVALVQKEYPDLS